MKTPVFPFVRFPGVDTLLRPEMKSTGEVMGGAESFGSAFAKAQLGALIEEALRIRHRLGGGFRPTAMIAAAALANQAIADGQIPERPKSLTPYALWWPPANGSVPAAMKPAMRAGSGFCESR